MKIGRIRRDFRLRSIDSVTRGDIPRRFLFSGIFIKLGLAQPYRTRYVPVGFTPDCSILHGQHLAPTIPGSWARDLQRMATKRVSPLMAHQGLLNNGSPPIAERFSLEGTLSGWKTWWPGTELNRRRRLFRAGISSILNDLTGLGGRKYFKGCDKR